MTIQSMLSFRHRFEPGDNAPRPLLLLHGTGGDEDDLIPFGRTLAPGAALLSPRGPVLERGMPRFFGRLAEGVFDLPEVRQRADDLADFVIEACERYGLMPPIAVGYSNGANVAAALMIRRPDVLAGAVLLRAMAVLDDKAAGLAGMPVLMLSGAQDPVVPASSAEALARQFRDGGAAVEHRILAAGHGLTALDASLAKAWLDGHRA